MGTITMPEKSYLVGYACKSKLGGAIQLSVDVEEFKKTPPQKSSDGREFVRMVVNADKIREILNGEREVTFITVIDG